MRENGGTTVREQERSRDWDRSGVRLGEGEGRGACVVERVCVRERGRVCNCFFRERGCVSGRAGVSEWERADVCVRACESVRACVL